MSCSVRLMLPNGGMDLVSVDPGTSVGSLLSSKGYSFGNTIVRVNRKEATESQILGNGDLVSVTMTDMKGAEEDVPEAIREKSYQDIVDYGAGKLSLTDSVLDQVLAEELKASQAAHKKVVAEVVANLRADFGCLNRDIAELEKTLVRVREQRAQAVYALGQLSEKNNIFSALAHLGLKDQAEGFCHRMGCSVPPADSPLWNTSAE
jgi:hypothetical protein